jgi:hypothetical protein
MRIPAALFAVVALWAPRAHATTMLQLDLEEHVLISSAVVEGRVSRQIVRVSEETGRPTTVSQVDVDRVLHGAAPETLLLRQLGGTLGETRTGISGDATLEAGERVVLFVKQGVEHGDEGFWFLTALGQSAYHVLGEGPDAPVRRDILQMDLLYRAPGGTLRPADATPDAHLDTLADLREAIAAASGGGP